MTETFYETTKILTVGLCKYSWNQFMLMYRIPKTSNPYNHMFTGLQRQNVVWWHYTNFIFRVIIFCLIFQMVHAVGQHKRVLNVSRMRFLVQRTPIQRSKNADCIIFTHVGRFVKNIVHYNTWLYIIHLL